MKTIPAGKILLIVFLLFLFPCISYAQSKPEQSAQEIKDKITRVNKEIVRLNASLATAKTKEKKAQLNKLISGNKSRKQKLGMMLEQLAGPPPVQEEALTVEAKAVKAASHLDVGILGGIYGSAAGVAAEARMPMAYGQGSISSSLRLATGLVQTEDASQRLVPVYVDAMVNYAAGWLSPVDNYIGAGLNYVVSTSDQRGGSYGGQVFYGTEGEGFGGKIFGEVGYGILRTGYSSSLRGIRVLCGYRMMWS